LGIRASSFAGGPGVGIVVGMLAWVLMDGLSVELWL